MNYVPWHIGDWESGTRLLTPLEKGIYMDLLMIYYSTERPIIRSYFDRITNRYTDEERKAFDFVIDTFFVEKEDGYHNERCDREIEACNKKSEAARRSIAARWSKKYENDTDGNTKTIRSKYERNTNEILTNNQEPITNNKDIEETKVSSLVENAPAERFPSEENTGLLSCPGSQIIGLFNSILGPALGAVRKTTPARQQAMRARWRDMLKDSGAKTQEEGLDWCKQYFEAVSKRPFLLGQKPDCKWRADFDWLMQQKNYTKIFEGAYRD